MGTYGPDDTNTSKKPLSREQGESRIRETLDQTEGNNLSILNSVAKDVTPKKKAPAKKKK